MRFDRLMAVGGFEKADQPAQIEYPVSSVRDTDGANSQ